MSDWKKLLAERESWLTRDGRIIPLCQMEDSHFKLVVSMVRRIAELEITAEGLQMLAGPRPSEDTHAYDAFEHEVMRSTDRPWTALPWTAPFC